MSTAIERVRNEIAINMDGGEFKNDLKTICDENASLQSTVDALERSRDGLRDTLDCREGQLQESRRQVDTLARQVDELKAERDELQNVMDVYRLTSASTEEALAAALQEVERLKAALGRLGDRLNDISVSQIPKVDFDLVNALDAITDEMKSFASTPQAADEKVCPQCHRAWRGGYHCTACGHQVDLPPMPQAADAVKEGK